MCMIDLCCFGVILWYDFSDGDIEEYLLLCSLGLELLEDKFSVCELFN